MPSGLASSTTSTCVCGAAVRTRLSTASMLSASSYVGSTTSVDGANPDDTGSGSGTGANAWAMPAMIGAGR